MTPQLPGPLHFENFAVHRLCLKNRHLEIPRSLRELGMTEEGKGRSE
jgi:hypothetical protein